MRRIDPGERWGDVVADSDATADAFRERNWTALAAHPGDVNPIADATRVDVLLPGSEFDAAKDAIGDIAIDAVRVYAAAADGVEYRLVVGEDADAGVAVCVPTYFGTAEFDALRAAVGDDGTLTIRLRPLDDRDVVEIELTDPGIFFQPPTDA